jgi:hypothetical protein
MLAVLALACTASQARARLPAWSDAPVQAAIPDWVAPAHRVVLFREQQDVLRGDGSEREITREVWRVIDPAGLRPVLGVLYYLRHSARIETQRAWIRHRDGTVDDFNGSDAVGGETLHSGELYGETMRSTLVADRLAAGDVVVVESETVEPALVAEWRCEFRDDAPVLLARFVLSLPEGVEPVVRAAGGAPAPAASGTTWTWERRDLRAWPDEPMTPASAYLAEQLVVAAKPGPTAGSARVGSAFADWNGLSVWLDGLARGTRELTPAIRAKAAELTGAGDAPFERLRSLARYVQGLSYVAIDLGLAHGGGYTPHPAEDVLRLAYGDCKDKANLFCALAASCGFESHLVSARIPDATHVRPEVPSPAAFNHCIAAIRVPDGVASPAVLRDPELGSLLFFDATDPLTPLGELPRDEQGAYVLIEDASRGRLVELPVAPPSANGTRLVFRGALAPSGALSGTMTRTSCGPDAVENRALGLYGGDASRAGLQRWLSAGGRTARVDSLVVTAGADGARVIDRAVVSFPQGARVLAAGMLGLQPCLAVAHPLPDLGDSARTLALLTPLLSEEDSVTIALPPGFAPDELPEPIDRHADFGDLRARWALAGDALEFHLSLRLVRRELPASRAGEVREFFRAAAAARRVTLVLARR